MRRTTSSIVLASAFWAGALLTALSSGCLLSAVAETDGGTDAGTLASPDGGDLSPEGPAPEEDGGAISLDAGAVDAGLAGGQDGGSAPPIGPQAGLELTITTGRIEGTQDGDLRIFKGIPYAEPPIGNQRFRAPTPKSPWQGTRPATAFGPSCPQADLGSLVLGDSGMSEDCLSLNIWAHDDGQQRPVMVFIYGGAFIIGSTSQPLYDAANLARAGDVTVVTINYRLGALGWLASEAIADDQGMPTAGNYGLQDQIEALRWVQDNIRAFGGDPDNVTIFGESAGAISVCALLGAPSADPLFHKAIIESGMCALGTYDGAGLIGMPSASVLSERIVEDVDCQDAFDVADCLRSRTTDELIGATSLLDVVTGDIQAISALSPIVDGTLIPAQPIDRIRSGDVNKPIIVGSNRDEGLLFTGADVVLTRIGFESRIEELVQDEALAESVAALYPFLEFPIVKDAWVAFMGEATFICPGLEVARASTESMPVFTYHFERLPLAFVAVGVMHGLELPYVFGNFGDLGIIPTATDLEVSEAMQEAWSSFASTGVPRLDVGWPAYTTDSPAVTLFDSDISTAAEIRNGRCQQLHALGVVY